MYHKDRHDMPHIERMGYASFTIYEWMWSNRDFCNELLSVARKDAIFLNRDHPLSEQKDDLWKNDPAQKGRSQADEWAQKVREGKVYTPLDRTFFLGINEPDSNVYQRQIDTYNEAFCRRMTQHGLLAAAYSFGVGQPSTVGLQPKAPVDWSWYAPSAAAILEGGHIAAFHEYGAPNNYGWEYWCNRVAACPYPFKAVFDECGIDHGVLKSGYLYGWAIALKPEEYVTWLDNFQLGMAERAHTRKIEILGYNIFSFDHGSGQTKDWHSFDIRPLRALLEAKQWSKAIEQPHTPQINTNLPGIFNGDKPEPRFMQGDLVRTTTKVNARSAPGTQNSVLTLLDSNVALELLEGPQHAAGLVWWRTAQGWVAEVAPDGIALLTNKVDVPAEVPPRPTNGIVHPHIAEAVFRVESGGKAFASDGRLVIRLELHQFRKYLGDNALFDTYFAYDPQQGHLDQRWRRSPNDAWQPSHLGSRDFDANQRYEWEVFGFAAKFNRDAALLSSSMGSAQVMGFHYARIGYPSAEAMFTAFQRSADLQTVGFFNYCVSDPALFAAMQQGNWTEIARRYNGDSKQVPVYVQLMKDAYQRIVQGD